MKTRVCLKYFVDDCRSTNRISWSSYRMVKFVGNSLTPLQTYFVASKLFFIYYMKRKNELNQSTKLSFLNHENRNVIEVFISQP